MFIINNFFNLSFNTKEKKELTLQVFVKHGMTLLLLANNVNDQPV